MYVCTVADNKFCAGPVIIPGHCTYHRFCLHNSDVCIYVNKYIQWSSDPLPSLGPVTAPVPAPFGGTPLVKQKEWPSFYSGILAPGDNYSAHFSLRGIHIFIHKFGFLNLIAILSSLSLHRHRIFALATFRPSCPLVLSKCRLAKCLHQDQDKDDGAKLSEPFSPPRTQQILH